MSASLRCHNSSTCQRDKWKLGYTTLNAIHCTVPSHYTEYNRLKHKEAFLHRLNP